MLAKISRPQSGVPTYADLFAGCGGLSLGLEWAGFRRAAAIEISPDAALTYYHNLVCREELAPCQWSTFLDSDKLQLSSGVIVGDIVDKLDTFLASCNLRSPCIDLIAGGPPCQGFSVAGRRDPDDPRNRLGDFIVEAARLLHPKAVLIENVPAVNMPFGGSESKASALALLVKKLEAHQYVTSVFHLKSSTVGVPQKRMRLFILGVQESVFEMIPAHYRLSWQVEDGLSGLIRADGHAPTAGEALADIGNEGYRLRFPSEYSELAYARSLRFSRKFAVPAALSQGKRIGYGKLYNHELRNHKPDTIARFECYLYLKRLGIHERLLHKASIQDKGQVASQIHSQLSQNGLCPDEVDRITQELVEDVLRFKTKKHTQIALDANSPARTVTTLPDDLIHYAEPRVLSVRELARLQSFPDSFIFKGKSTTGGAKRRVEAPQYSQVGNAVPPLMARAVGRLVRSLLECTAESSNPDKAELKSGDSTKV